MLIIPLYSYIYNRKSRFQSKKRFERKLPVSFKAQGALQAGFQSVPQRARYFRFLK
jgi:hypothetical protein